MADKQHRIATTARVGGRRTRAEQAEAKAMLEAFSPTKEDFKHPLEVELCCGNGLALLGVSSPDKM